MTFTPKAIEAAKAIDFAKESRDLKQALADNAYPAADGSADIDNHAIPIIEATLRNVAERFLAAALAVDGMAQQGWQPIATIPMDGEGYLVTCANVEGGFLQAVYGENGRLHVADANISYPLEFFTHWMPEPEPPPPAASDREERR